jgi:DNA topoisomerase-1
LTTLIIVESPAKARTIKGFLGRNYDVKASLGHVRDLPRSRFGIDVENNFEPDYITIRGKGPVLKELRDAAKKADRILLATDPDREGEAIAWHLATALKLKDDKCRIDFREITKDAIKQAVKKPRGIYRPLVDAQQARRVVDRIVGYELSPLLWAKVKRGLSAGRVQSVAVKLIVDREREIEAFVPQEYWSVTAHLQTDGGEGFEAKLLRKSGKKIELPNEDAARQVEKDVTGQPWKVTKVTRKERRRNPAPPFTTSTLQQEAARKLGFAAKKTMRLAQQLYEGLPMGKLGTLGLITYMRTDATNVSKEAVAEVREFIKDAHGTAYVPSRPRQYASKKGAQEAHEAVRPTSALRTPEEVKPYLSRDQLRLYKLIWERFVASQMSSAVFDAMSVDISVQDYLFSATGSQLKFAGFLKIYQEGSDTASQDENGDRLLPELKEEEEVRLQKLDLGQHFTQPPPRFTEAMLVKTLEEEGIGRPSTYAPIIDTIVGRGYVYQEEKRFRPTELGVIVTDLLAESFPRLLDVKFTAGLEEELDRIEEGDIVWQDVISEFYKPFAEDLQKAHAELERIEVQDEVSDVICENCGRNMVYKLGRFGKFLACPGYPECKNTKPILDEIGVECSVCRQEGREGGQLVRRRTRRGRFFYGCSNYPDCTYTSWQRPTAELCPYCGKNLTVAKEGAEPKCSNKECPGGDDQ